MMVCERVRYECLGSGSTPREEAGTPYLLAICPL